MKDSPYGASELERVGLVLFGQTWQSDMARSLGIKDTRRIRHWMAGTRTIPAGVWDDIFRLLRERGEAALQLRLELLERRST